MKKSRRLITLSIACDMKVGEKQKEVIRKHAELQHRSVSALVIDSLINGPTPELSQDLRHVSRGR